MNQNQIATALGNGQNDLDGEDEQSLRQTVKIAAVVSVEPGIALLDDQFYGLLAGHDSTLTVGLDVQAGAATQAQQAEDGAPVIKGLNHLLGEQSSSDGDPEVQGRIRKQISRLEDGGPVLASPVPSDQTQSIYKDQPLIEVEDVTYSKWQERSRTQGRAIPDGEPGLQQLVADAREGSRARDSVDVSDRNRLVAPYIYIDGASSDTSPSQASKKDRDPDENELADKTDEKVESAYRRQNTALEVGLNVDRDAPRRSTLQNSARPAREPHLEEIVGLNNLAVGGRHLQQQMTVQDRNHQGSSLQVKYQTSLGLNARIAQLNQTKTKNALYIVEPSISKYTIQEHSCDSSFVRESAIGSFVLKNMMNNQHSASQYAPPPTDKLSSPGTLNMSRLSTIRKEPDLENELQAQSPVYLNLQTRADSFRRNRIWQLGQFQDSSVLRTVSTIEKMKQQPTHKNMIVERNEMDERDKDSNGEDQKHMSNTYLGPMPAHLTLANQETNEDLVKNDTTPTEQRRTPYLLPEDATSQQLHVPSQDDQQQLNQRMQSIIVQKVTKMYSASQDPLTNSQHDSGSQGKPFRGQTIYDQNWKLNQCQQALEFIIVGYCKSFDFQNPLQAAHFVAEYDELNDDGSSQTTSQYIMCLQDVDNFQKINNFLSLLQTNLKHLIHLLEQENDVSFYLARSQQSQPNASSDRLEQDLEVKNGKDRLTTARSDPTTSSLHIIMNLLSLGLSKSVDDRIVWQTCNLLSGIFQFVSGISVNQGFQALVIQWALNRDVRDNQLPIDRATYTDFISRCLYSRREHQSVSSPIMNLFFEVANLGRLKKNQQKQSSLILHDIFSTIIPYYFNYEEEHSYFELMEDALSSHLFQYEKDRIDKQYLLYVYTDRCFQKMLAYLNESKRLESFRASGRLNNLQDSWRHDAVYSVNASSRTGQQRGSNTYIQIYNILLSIWQNNSSLFKNTVYQHQQQFQTLTKAIKLECKQSIEALQFGYAKFGGDTTIEYIAIRLLYKSVRKATKLVRVATIFKIQALAEYFQKNQEAKKEEFMVQILVAALLDQRHAYLEAYDAFAALTDSAFAWRQAIFQYLVDYFAANRRSDYVNTFIEEYTDYLQSLIQGTSAAAAHRVEDMLIFNQHALIKYIIAHPKLSNDSAIALFDLLSQIVFMNEYADFLSKRSACLLIQALFAVTEVELAQQWMSLIKFACMELTKLEMIILQNQLEGRYIPELYLQRHVVYLCVDGVIRSAQEPHNEQGNILNFCKFFLCSLSALERTPKTIIKLKDLLLQQMKNQDQKVIEIKKEPQVLLAQRTILPGGNMYKRRMLELQNAKDSSERDEEKFNKQNYDADANRQRPSGKKRVLRYYASTRHLGYLVVQETRNSGGRYKRLSSFGNADEEGRGRRPRPSAAKESEIESKRPVAAKFHLQAVGEKQNAVRDMRTTRSFTAGVNRVTAQKDDQEALSTFRLAKCNYETRQRYFESDLLGQSFGTTLRTEIYSSEEEYEMVNYYAFLSDYKKEIHDFEGHNEDPKDQEEAAEDDSPLIVRGQRSLLGTETPLREASLANPGPAAAEGDNDSSTKLLRYKKPTSIVFNRYNTRDKQLTYEYVLNQRGQLNDPSRGQVFKNSTPKRPYEATQASNIDEAAKFNHQYVASYIRIQGEWPCQIVKPKSCQIAKTESQPYNTSTPQPTSELGQPSLKLQKTKHTLSMQNHYNRQKSYSKFSSSISAAGANNQDILNKELYSPIRQLGDRTLQPPEGEDKSRTQDLERVEVRSQGVHRNLDDGDKSSLEPKSRQSYMPPIQRTKPPSVYIKNQPNARGRSNGIESEAAVVMSRSHNDRSRTTQQNDQDNLPHFRFFNEDGRHSVLEPKSAELPVLRNDTSDEQQREAVQNFEQIAETPKIYKREDSQNSLFESWKKNKLKDCLANAMNETPRDQPIAQQQYNSQSMQARQQNDHHQNNGVGVDQDDWEPQGEGSQVHDAILDYQRNLELMRDAGAVPSERKRGSPEYEELRVAQYSSVQTGGFLHHGYSISKPFNANDSKQRSRRILDGQAMDALDRDERPSMRLDFVNLNDDAGVVRLEPPLKLSLRPSKSNNNSSEIFSNQSRQYTYNQNPSESSQLQSVKTPMSFGNKQSKARLERAFERADADQKLAEIHQNSISNDSFAQRAARHGIGNVQISLSGGTYKRNVSRLRASKNNSTEQRIQTLRSKLEDYSPNQNFKTPSLPPIANKNRDNTVSAKPPTIPKKTKKAPKLGGDGAAGGGFAAQIVSNSAPRAMSAPEHGNQGSGSQSRKDKSMVTLPALCIKSSQSTAHQKTRRTNKIDNSTLIVQNAKKRRRIRTLIPSKLSHQSPTQRAPTISAEYRQQYLQQSERQKRIAKYYGLFQEQKTHDYRSIKKEQQPFSRYPLNNKQYSKQDAIILRQNDQVPDLSLQSGRMPSSNWSQNLRLTRSHYELPQYAKKIKIVKRAGQDKEAIYLPNQIMAKDRSIPATPKMNLKAVKLKKLPLKTLDAAEPSGKVVGAKTPASADKQKLKPIVRSSVSQEKAAAAKAPKSAVQEVKTPKQSIKIKLKPMAKNEPAQKEERKPQKAPKNKKNKTESDVLLNLKQHEDQMADYQKVIEELQVQIEKLQEENQRDRQARYSASNTNLPRVASSRDVAYNLTIPIHMVVNNKENDEKLNDETQQPVNVVMDTVSSGQHRSSREELANAPSRRRQLSNRVIQSQRQSQNRQPASEQTARQQIISDIKHDFKVAPLYSFLASMGPAPSYQQVEDSARPQARPQANKPSNMDSVVGPGAGTPPISRTNANSASYQIAVPADRNLGNTTAPDDWPPGQPQQQPHPLVSQQLVMPYNPVPQPPSSYRVAQHAYSALNSAAQSSLYQAPPSQSTMYQIPNHLQVPASMPTLHLAPYEYIHPIQPAPSGDHSSYNLFSPVKTPSYNGMLLQRQLELLSSGQQQYVAPLPPFTPSGDMITLAYAGQYLNRQQQIMNAIEKAGTLQRTPVGDDSEFQRDSNATFVIGNTLGLGHATPKDVGNYLKHSTTFKEFLAWREAKKFQSNPESVDHGMSKQVESGPTTGQAQAEQRAADNYTYYEIKRGPKNADATMTLHNQGSVEERSDDFEFYRDHRGETRVEKSLRNEGLKKKQTMMSSGSSVLEDIRTSFKGSIPNSVKMQSPVSQKFNESRPQMTISKPIHDSQEFDASAKPPPSLSRQKSKFYQLLNYKDEKREDAHKIYVRQLSNSAQKMKQEVQKDFYESVQELNLDSEKLNMMRYKSMKRIEYLRKQSTMRSNRSGQSANKAADPSMIQPNSGTLLPSKDRHSEAGAGTPAANPSNLFQKYLTQLTNKYVQQLQNSEIDDDSAENKASI